jgi:Phage integrase, N-terminal SAM-like domain
MTDNSVPTFSTAAAAWFEGHKRYIKPSTADCYGDALKALSRFFGDKPINEIALVHVRMYQQLRSSEVSAHAVNRELGVLQQVLKKFGQWAHLQGRYRQLKEPPSRSGKTHSVDVMAQKQHLSGQSDSESSHRGTGNLICFPIRGGAA